jgi:hypothetical protein
MRSHERFREGLAWAVAHDMAQEHAKKRHQPRGLKRSSRNVVSKSTTN